MIRPERTSRRRMIASVGAGIAAVAGCLDDGFDGEPTYEDGSVREVNASNATGRSATEMTAAEAVAEREANTSVTPLESLSLVDHRFVVEDGYLGSTVQGTVENTGSDRIEVVEVRVRVYDEGGSQLGRYLASTSDLDGGSSWAFQVVVLKPPGVIADYDITVLGTPT